MQLGHIYLLVMTIDLGVAMTISKGARERVRSTVRMSNNRSLMRVSSMGCGAVVRGGGVRGMSGLGNLGGESVVRISLVVDSAGGSISLKEGVVALDDVSIASLGLALLVASVGISHSVLKGVFRGRLRRKMIYYSGSLKNID
jgi:hypothetical protein